MKFLSKLIIGSISTLLFILFIASTLDKGGYPLEPVSLKNVTITDEFWSPRIENNRKVSIPYLFKKFEETGNYGGSLLYKTLEGAIYTLAYHPDPQLEGLINKLIDKSLEFFVSPEAGMKLKDSDWDRRLYSMGHLFEAAVAYYQSTQNKRLLDAALRIADTIDSVYGPDKRHYVTGHQEIEVGFTRLSGLTGDEKYWRLAKFFLDERGRDNPKRSGEFALNRMYSQDHKPVNEQREAVGHCVRATYMFLAMTDVTAATGDAGYENAINSIWEDAVFKKTFLTGGVGSIRFHEQFGSAYELPNLNCWNETCAAYGNVLWNHRLFLLYRDAQYIDMMERILYNGFLVGVSLKGDRFFYQNPLKSFGNYERFSWINVPCCPPNVVRLIASLGSYIYAKSGNDIYVNLFIGSRAQIKLKNHNVELYQETRYPWDGNIKLTVNPDQAGKFTVFIRLPMWSRNQPMPGDLYHYMEKNDEKVALKVNGKPYKMKIKKGYAQIEKNWKRGDVIELILPMPVRKVLANGKVRDDEGRVALERGPLVYCAEWPDNDGNVLNLLMPDDAVFAGEFRQDILDGVTVVKGNVQALKRGEDNSSVKTEQHELTAIPYYAWANRGMGEMAVWLARRENRTRLTPVLPEPVSRVSEFSGIEKIWTGYNDQNDELSAVYDGVDPLSSRDESNLYFRMRPPVGKLARIQYDFKKEIEVSSSSVYWVDDRRFCRLPESWRILYRDGSQWKEVQKPSEFGIKKDRFNTVQFSPVKTTSIRLEIEPQTIFYKTGQIGPPEALFLKEDINWRECGIIEWRFR